MDSNLLAIITAFVASATLIWGFVSGRFTSRFSAKLTSKENNRLKIVTVLNEIESLMTQLDEMEKKALVPLKNNDKEKCMSILRDQMGLCREVMLLFERNKVFYSEPTKQDLTNKIASMREEEFSDFPECMLYPFDLARDIYNSTKNELEKY